MKVCYLDIFRHLGTNVDLLQISKNMFEVCANGALCGVERYLLRHVPGNDLRKDLVFVDYSDKSEHSVCHIIWLKVLDALAFIIERAAKEKE